MPSLNTNTHKCTYTNIQIHKPKYTHIHKCYKISHTNTYTNIQLHTDTHNKVSSLKSVSIFRLRLTETSWDQLEVEVATLPFPAL